MLKSRKWEEEISADIPELQEDSLACRERLGAGGAVPAALPATDCCAPLPGLPPTSRQEGDCFQPEAPLGPFIFF